MNTELKSVEEQLCRCKRDVTRGEELKSLLDERTSQYDELQSRCDELERKLKEAQIEDEKRLITLRPRHTQRICPRRRIYRRRRTNSSALKFIRAYT